MFLTKRTFVAAAAAIALMLPAKWATAQERLTVVATTGMIADAAMNVGGDLVEVQALMGPGIDPHSYRQTRTDIVAQWPTPISCCGTGSIWKRSSKTS